jgi:lipopolysaccharide transport system ATP-binding protein
VRLAFAVAAHLEPEILIVDEVLAVGDAQFQKKCLGKMQEVANTQGRTVIFVSHTMNAVAAFCHRVLVLEGGTLAFSGPTGEAISRYLGRAQDNEGQTARIAKGSAENESPVTLTELTLNEGMPVLSRGRLEATLRFTVHRPIAAIGFGLGLCGMDGHRIVTLESDYAGNYFRLDGDGATSVRLSLPVLDLAPGRYRVDVGAFNAAHVAFHYAPDCMSVEIKSAAETPAHLLHGTNDYRPASAWHLEPWKA